MASIIEGFSYDIFISYRQKDNKYDSWVTEFVDNLKKELEATFKEDISVYFDISTHDGLLETHDVNASLSNKLKCLVFIPIISRTYCDPKSFAWEHEFKAFIEQASHDQYGLKVKLPNGYVAGRVLPVRIHDLDNEDIQLCESLLGGVLRGVEFIYKSAGVNRPLRSAEEKANENLNKTIYRDQINKVALAIKEIVSALDPNTTKSERGRKEAIKPFTSPGKSIKSRIILGTVIAVSLLVLGYILIPKLLTSGKEIEKSIAVLPFINDSPDQANGYFINGLMDEILNKLQRIKEFRVISRTSTMQFSGKDRPSIPEIADKLGVNYVIEGSGQKYGDKFVLRVQLIAAKNEAHLWGESYEQEIDEVSDIIRIQSKIAEAIALELKATITPAEKQIIEKIPTTSITAYDFCQRGTEELYSFLQTGSLESLQRSEVLFRKAIENDSTYAAGYTGVAFAYLWKAWIFSEKLLSVNYLDTVLILNDKALYYDPLLPEAYFSRAIYYNMTGKPDQAINEFEEAIRYNPNYSAAYEWLGGVVYLASLYYSDYVKGLECLHKAASLTMGQELPGILDALAYGYAYRAGFPEMGEKYLEEFFKLSGDTALYIAETGMLEIQFGDFDKGIKKCLQAYSMNSDGWRPGLAYFFHGDYKESYKYWEKTINYYKSSGLNLQGMQNFFGYLLWQNGFKTEAEYWFNEQLKLSLEAIKLGRFYSTGGNGSRNAYFDLAALYAFRGENEKALEMLGMLDRCPVISKIMLDEIKTLNPLFNGIRSEPEFQRIVKSWEAKYQAEHDRVKKWLKEQKML